MSNSLLVSLAFLKINWDTNRSIYLDNFLPFIAECLRGSSSEAISQNALQVQLRLEFGLEIPLHVIKTLLTRGRKNGIVHLDNRVYYSQREALTNSQFRTNQQKVQRIYNALINDFCDFSLKKYSKNISNEEAENSLLAFIRYNQIYLHHLDKEPHAFSDIPMVSHEMKVIISDYITKAYRSNPQSFEYLDTIIKGYMIYNALYLSDPHNTNRKFKRTKVFLDTTFVMHSLGYSGEEFSAPCQELLEMLYTTGAHLYCFRHTVEEMKAILDACSSCLGKIDDSVFGRSVQYFTSKGYTSSDVRLLISKLERNLEYQHIKILDKPSYSDHEHIIDERELLSDLKSQMPRQRENALSRDIDSISAIYRLRGDNKHYNIEDSPAIFVTTNSTLARTANEHYYKHNERSFTPPCITDFELTNIIWLKSPTRAPDLPIKRVIADCYAAIQPNEELMQRWIEEVEKLELSDPSTEEDYYFMRYSDEVRMAIMDLTLGDAEAITEGSVPLILEKARQKIREDVEKELASEVEKREAVEQDIAEIRESIQNKETKRKENIRIRSQRIAHAMATCVRFILFIFLIIAIVLSLPLNSTSQDYLQNFIDVWPKSLMFIFLLIILFLYSANQLFGVEVNSIINRIELYFQKQVHRFFIYLSEKILELS